MKIKITRIGNSAGIILPKSLLTALRLKEGCDLYATRLPDGIKLTAYDPRHMEVAERIMRKDRKMLKKLAEN
jgi:putative addiction module antidote